MNLLIIGNGFDIAHGLPTRYAEFLNFANATLNEKDNKKYLFDFDIETIQKAKRLSAMNIWRSYLSNLTNLSKPNGNWIDFEEEILQVIKRLNVLITFRKEKGENDYVHNKHRNEIDYLYDILEKCNNEEKYVELLGDETLEDFTGFKIRILNDLNRLVKCLELYLHDLMGRYEFKEAIKDIPIDFEFDGVLNFNYTDTFEKLYKAEKIVYVHGRAREDEETDMILGIDEYLDDDTKNQDIECIEFKKYFQRIFKKTGNQYKKWLASIEEKAKYFSNYNFYNYVFIYGHSLGYSDREILKEFFDAKRTKITIFYHNEEAHKRYIANLVRIIGQDDVIRRVYGHNPTIIFEEQDKNLPIHRLAESMDNPHA